MRTRTYHKLNEVNYDFLKLIDMATDPAMKSIFERAQVALNVLAIQLGESTLDAALERASTERIFKLLDDAPEGQSMADHCVEQVIDLGWQPGDGPANYNGLPGYINPQWPHSPSCYHVLHICDSVKGWHYDLVVYTPGEMWCDEGDCLHTLVENGRRYLVSKGLV